MNASASWSNFPTRPLKRLAAIRSSNVDKIIEEGERAVLLCNYVDVYYNRLINDQIPFATGSATQAEIEKFGLREGDIVITKDSETPHDIAVAALVEPSAAGVVCGYHLAMLRPQPRLVLASYMFWCLSAQPLRDEFSIRAQGITRFGLTLNGIGSVPIPLPDFDTQKAIATFLDRETARIDQLIAKKERQAEVLAEREEATFIGIVTGTDRDGEKKPSGVAWIGDIPTHWQAPKFTHVSRQETGHTPSRKDDTYWVPEECVIPWFSLADVWQIRSGGQIYVSETTEKISQVGMDNSAARLLPAATVILSRTASVGFAAILSVPMATTQDFVGWICGERVRPKFLYYVLRAMKPEFRRLMIGSTHQTIYMPDIRSFRTPLPPLDEQDEIIDRLDRITGRFRAAAVKIMLSVEKLKEYRAALITAAVTGQINASEQPPAVLTKPGRARFRVIVGAEIVQRHQGNPKFGRVKFQKELYLAEAHVGIDELQGAYLREAAGPLDRVLVEETERGMEASGFFNVALPDIRAKSSGVTYNPLAKAGHHRAELTSLLGPRAEALRTMIDLLRDFETRSVEAVATLYAVWNDALIDGETPDDAAIIYGVLNDWHPEKQEKFTKADLQHWLDWMKRNGLVPRGKGPRTVSTTPRDLFAS
jgi:type I restriction enzyme, S subunit